MELSRNCSTEKNSSVEKILGFMPEGNFGVGVYLTGHNIYPANSTVSFYTGTITTARDLLHGDWQYKSVTSLRRALTRFLWEFPEAVDIYPHSENLEFGDLTRILFETPDDICSSLPPLITDWTPEDVRRYQIEAESDYVIFSDKAGQMTAVYLKSTNQLFIRYCESYDKGAEVINELKKRIAKLTSLVRAPGMKFPKNVKSAKIGADIEFTVFDSDNNFHPATEFVNDTQEGQIGTDGNVETLEIRPEVATNPLQLVENIEELLSALNDTLPAGHDLLGGGGYALHRATGTHIHFSGISSDITKKNGMQPDELVSWLDAMILAPVSHMQGVRRADEHYGRPGDYRNKNNHRQFPHEGFEWRPLPTMILDKDFTRGLFCTAWCIMVAFEAGQTIKFDENNFGIEWFKGLPQFDEYEVYIRRFVQLVQKKVHLDVPVLREWFSKEFKKDKECDIEIVFCNDEPGYLAISSFIMFNPQKEFDRVVIWSRSSSQAVAVSSKCERLQRYILQQLGTTTSVVFPSDLVIAKYKKGRTLFVGIPSVKLRALASGNAGSRNRVKMFVQDIIKNL